MFAAVDDERMERLVALGTPPRLPEWSGWWAPTGDDLARLHTILDRETNKSPSIFSLKLGSWLLIGESPLRPHIRGHVPETAGSLTTLPMSTLSVVDIPAAHVAEDHEMTDAPPPVPAGSHDPCI